MRSGEVVVVVEAPAFFRNLNFGECTVAARAQRGRHRRNVNKRLRTQRGILYYTRTIVTPFRLSLCTMVVLCHIGRTIHRNFSTSGRAVSVILLTQIVVTKFPDKRPLWGVK